MSGDPYVTPEVFAKLTAASREADREFERTGETGTRNYLRDFLLPAMDNKGLKVVDK